MATASAISITRSGINRGGFSFMYMIRTEGHAHRVTYYGGERNGVEFPSATALTDGAEMWTLVDTLERAGYTLFN